MRFLPPDRLKNLNFEPHELLFLDCWYGLTHERSLDSYRVKCLNARTIVLELCDELRIGRQDELEFHGICAEALSLLNSDPVVPSVFAKGFAALEPFLKEPPSLPGSSQKKDKPESETRLRHLMFAATDLSAALNERYFATLCNRLYTAVGQKDQLSIESLANAILSDLVSRGWTLGELYKWHRKFLADDGKTFNENLDFLLRQLKRPASDFNVILRISGGNNVQQLTHFGQFHLTTDTGKASDKQHEQRFLAPDEYSTFAQGTFTAVDFISAAIVARSEMEPLLDALRFEFEPRLLEIDKRSLVTRQPDGRAILVVVSNPVPNPVESFDEQDFATFSSKLSAVLSSPSLELESKNRIETAFRRYRAGRDSHNYSEKFLNWWMGLEALANVGGTKIGRTVMENVSHAMLHGYMFRILRDFLATIKFLKPPWTPAQQQLTGSDNLDDLDVPRLISLLHDNALSATLWDAIKHRQHVVTRGQFIRAWLTDPKKAAEQLALHRERLRWHINRLYRIRCCLVHGSPLRFRLALYSANLEYYLKQTLMLTLDALHENPHISDLASLFQRSVVNWDRQFKKLEDNGADQSTIMDAVFFSIAAKD